LFESQDIFAGSRVSDDSCLNLLGINTLIDGVCLANSSKPSILFIGDSHAMALHSAIYAKSLMMHSILVSAHSCHPFPNLAYTPVDKNTYGKDCAAITNVAIDAAQKNNSIDTVVLSNFFSQINDSPSEYKFNGTILTNREAFYAGYSSLIDSLTKLNKKVVFVVDVPHLKNEPRRCAKNLFFNEPIDCRFTSKEHFEKRIEYTSAVNELKIKFSQLEIFDPTEFFCTNAFCEFTEDGKSMYNDAHHISLHASKKLLTKMIEGKYIKY